MEKNYEVKKYPVDKIVLLSLFIGSLLIARLIIASKSVVFLTSPVELDYAGLSVSMPVGNGWNTQEQWVYKDSAFALGSIFMPASAGPAALAYCQYLINVQPVELEKLFEQKAAQVDGEILKKDRITAGEVVIEFVHIRRKGSGFNMFFGTTDMPYRRRFEIETHQAAGGTDLAWKAFEKITGNLKFKRNLLLETGSKVVTEIKNAGLAELLKGTDRLTFFSFTDTQNRTLGFTMDKVVLKENNPEFNIEAESFLYIRGPFPREQAVFFQSSNNLDSFIWKYRDTDVTATNVVEMTLDENDMVTVRKSRTGSEVKQYQLSSAAIPEVFLDMVFYQMLKSGVQEVIVDVIESKGQIAPLLVSGITAEDSGGIKTEQVYMFEIKLLDGSGFSEKVFIDNQGTVFKKLLAKEQITLERTTLDNIVKQFPERAEYILQKAEMPEQN